MSVCDCRCAWCPEMDWHLIQGVFMHIPSVQGIGLRSTSARGRSVNLSVVSGQESMQGPSPHPTTH